MTCQQLSVRPTGKTQEVTPRIALHCAFELPDIRRATFERLQGHHPPLPHCRHHCHRLSEVSRIFNTHFDIDPQ
jgi:hypothetical protein